MQSVLTEKLWEQTMVDSTFPAAKCNKNRVQGVLLDLGFPPSPSQASQGGNSVYHGAEILSLPINSPHGAAALAAILRKLWKACWLTWASVFAAGQIRLPWWSPCASEERLICSRLGITCVHPGMAPTRNPETGELVPGQLWIFKEKWISQFYSLYSRSTHSWKKSSHRRVWYWGAGAWMASWGEGGGKAENNTD
jgi:hypothetical protein